VEKGALAPRGNGASERKKPRFRRAAYEGEGRKTTWVFPLQVKLKEGSGLFRDEEGD